MTSTASSATGRLNTLTGLRFVAAAAVFASHVSYHLSTPSHTVLAPFFDQGRAGVSFFFVLSGFVLAWSGSTRRGAADFYRRRIARIYPAFLVMWIIGCALVVAFNTAPHSIGRLALGALLLQDWAPDSTWYFAGNGVSWSLSCEFVFYALFPLLLAPLKRMGSAGRRWAMLAAIAASLALAVFGQLTYTGDGYQSLPNTFSTWIVSYLPLSRLPEFIVGVALALEARSGRHIDIGWIPALLLALVAYLCAGFWPSVFSSVAIVVAPFALLIGAGAAADARGQRTIFARRPLVWLGEISFCFYLIHGLVLLGYGLKFPASPDLITVPITFGLSIAGAAALHYGVERPAYDLLKGSSRTQTTAARVEVTASKSSTAVAS